MPVSRKSCWLQDTICCLYLVLECVSWVRKETSIQEPLVYFLKDIFGLPVGRANNSFEFSNFRIFGLWDGEIVFTFLNFLKSQYSYCSSSWCLKTIYKANKTWREGSRFRVKCSSNPGGKSVSGVFTKRKILRQISVNISVLETWRTLRSCKVVSIPVPSIAEGECEVSTTSHFCRRKAKVSRN